MNPYINELEDLYRGEYVAVHKDGDVYVGHVSVINWHEREIILRGTPDGPVAITDYDTLTLENPDAAPEVTTAQPRNIAPNPCSARTHTRDDPGMARYIRTLRQRGSLATFPVVVRTSTVPDYDPGTEYVLLSGHRRVFAAGHANIGPVPVQVWRGPYPEAVKRWVDEHIPLDNDERQDGKDDGGWYDLSEIAGALRQLADRHDPDFLWALPAVQYWLRFPDVDVWMCRECGDVYEGTGPLKNHVRATDGDGHGESGMYPGWMNTVLPDEW